MSKIEYHVLKLASLTGDSEVSEKLNALGKEGWQLSFVTFLEPTQNNPQVSNRAYVANGFVQYIFTRDAKEPPRESNIF